MPLIANIALAYLLIECLNFALCALISMPRSSEYAIESTAKYYLVSATTSIYLLIALSAHFALNASTALADSALADIAAESTHALG